jgi:hypothetical protein
MRRWLGSRAWAIIALAGGVLSAGWGRSSGPLLVIGGVLVAAGLAAQALLGLAASRRRLRTFWIRFIPASLLTLAVGSWYWANSPRLPGLGLAAVALVLAGLWLARRAPASAGFELEARHLPGASEQPPVTPRWPYGFAAVAVLGFLVLSFAAAAASLPAWVILGLAVPTTLALVITGVEYQRLATRNQSTIRALRQFAPVYAMPYNGYASFHVGLWLPYLERTGKPVVVVTTTRLSFERVADRYSVPVIYTPQAHQRAAIQAMFPPSVRAAFYVHNGGNGEFLKIKKVTHVFVHHGDSDKETSARPRTAVAYDVLVVAGQAAVDRFAVRGIQVPSSKFKVLGRPQIEEIRTADHPISAVEHPVVLYAPTWQGSSEETNYSSLPVGAAIVQALLARNATVVFRPHPAGRGDPDNAAAISDINALLAADAKATGRKHRWGKAADKPTVGELTNQVDAMVSDVSGMVTDFLQSLKPFAMVSTKLDTEQFRARFPSSQAAYVIEGDLSTLNSALDDMFGDDPLAAVRAERRRYYLGGFEDGESAKAFISYAESLAGESAPVAHAHT